MNCKTLALLSTSLVALGFSATTSNAAATMGRVDLGFTEWFDHYDYDGEGSYDSDYPSLTGDARVNIPYNNTVNLQLDFFGDASLDSGYHGVEGNSNGLGNVGVGAHINARDTSEGLLGVFAATGRVWDYSYYNTPAFMAGLEGQYYCGNWTIYGQAGYMDSDGLYDFLQNGGFVRALVSYYPSQKLKITGGLGYIDGDANYGSGTTFNANAWAWQAGAEYWFGKSVPVAAFFKYQGRQQQTHFPGDFTPELTTNEVTAGVTFYFGGDSIEEADRTGAGTEIPNFDWFRLIAD